MMTNINDKIEEAKVHLDEAQEHFNKTLEHFEQLQNEHQGEIFALSFGAECQNTFFDLAATFEIKNKQYGRHDPLGNFRNGAMLRYGDDSWEHMYETAKSYCLKHVAHVFGKGQAIDDKNVDESLHDIAVYCVIMEYMIGKHKEELAQKVREAVTASSIPEETEAAQ